MPKSSKRFVISNSGLNAQGFRMLTEGAQLDSFRENPLLLFNHQRPEGNSKDQILPLGYWTDLEIEGDDITGIPYFDDKDEFALKIYDKVENGILRMCSAGAEPIETSADPALLLPGQSRETVTKWVLKEASICDIGANPSSLATVALYNGGSGLIKLAEQTEQFIPKIANMAKTTDEKPPKKGVKLSDDTATDKPVELTDDPEEELSEDDKDEVIAKLKEELAALKEELKLSQEQMRLAEEEKLSERVEQLVNKAVSLKKITLVQKASWVKLARQDFDSAKEALEGMKAPATVKEQLGGKEVPSEDSKLVALAAKSFEELFRDGDLQYLKLHAPEIYKEKYKAKFGTLPKNI